MFTNKQNAEVKLQIVGERGLKIVAQTLARTRYKLRQYLNQRQNQTLEHIKSKNYNKSDANRE